MNLIILTKVCLLYLAFRICSMIRDDKIGQARRAGPPARPKKGGPGWNF